eukprot:Rhum_TRINITY_DN14479_c4_g1::Rhum_TRINITY_DN14479_c4_g1_i1::g.91865::m.91865
MHSEVGLGERGRGGRGSRTTLLLLLRSLRVDPEPRFDHPLVRVDRGVVAPVPRLDELEAGCDQRLVLRRRANTHHLVAGLQQGGHVPVRQVVEVHGRVGVRARTPPPQVGEQGHGHTQPRLLCTRRCVDAGQRVLQQPGRDKDHAPVRVPAQLSDHVHARDVLLERPVLFLLRRVRHNVLRKRVFVLRRNRRPRDCPRSRRHRRRRRCLGCCLVLTKRTLAPELLDARQHPPPGRTVPPVPLPAVRDRQLRVRRNVAQRNQLARACLPVEPDGAVRHTRVVHPRNERQHHGVSLVVSLFLLLLLLPKIKGGGRQEGCTGQSIRRRGGWNQGFHQGVFFFFFFM